MLELIAESKVATANGPRELSSFNDAQKKDIETLEKSLNDILSTKIKLGKND